MPLAQSSGTPYLLTIGHKILSSPFYYLLMCLKYCCMYENSVDPDQMPQNAASDLGLHRLQKCICPNT